MLINVLTPRGAGASRYRFLRSHRVQTVIAITVTWNPSRCLLRKEGAATTGGARTGIPTGGADSDDIIKTS